MSVSFLRNFFKCVEHIFEDNAKRNIVDGKIALKIRTLSTILVGHGIYAYSTKANDEIVVTKKYKMNRNGFTDFMIIDDKGRHFNVNNSLWYWKWDSIEDWHRIKENSEEKLLIKYYGWRVPVFGLFPNITLSDKAQFLNSMTSAQFRIFEYNNDKKNNI
jgi:hypothetical protein